MRRGQALKADTRIDLRSERSQAGGAADFAKDIGISKNGFKGYISYIGQKTMPAKKQPVYEMVAGRT